MGHALGEFEAAWFEVLSIGPRGEEMGTRETFILVLGGGEAVSRKGLK